MTSIAFLGPRGTFSEAALRSMPHSEGADLVPVRSVTAALAAVRSGEVDLALVPIENSLEGNVTASLDELSMGEPLCIVAECALPVTFALMARPGIALADVRTVETHPAAEAQTRGWLRANAPQATVSMAVSTAAAAQDLAEGGSFDAAIAPVIAAEFYGLTVLADDIGDADSAATRFVLVSRLVPPEPPTGADKTTLVLFMRADHSGALHEILNELSVRGVNLTRIESRPTKRALGDYFFVVDAEGHVSDPRLGEAMMGLHRVCSSVRYLGSYPRHDQQAPEVRPGTSDAEFRAAREWLSAVRDTGRSS